MSSVHVSTEAKQDYATPHEFVRAVEQEYAVSMMLDLAANEENAKCDHFLALPMNSLSVDWVEALRLRPPLDDSRPCAWLNPPFRGIDPWMEKCKVESAKGMRIVSLTLASIGTAWYRKHVEGGALSLVLRRRITFVGQPTGFPKELMITLWGFGMTGLGFWTPPAWAVKESPKGEAPAEAQPQPEQSEELWPLEQEV
jgi:phage N-6-adenine-methyltransferase